MEVKSGYKQTEVGVIPDDWEVKSFQSIAHLERGKFTARPRNDPKYYGGDIPFIQTGDVTNSNGQIKSYSQTLNSEGLRVSKLFIRGTLFFTIAANIGDVGFADFDTACPDSLVAITPANNIDRFWLSHELRGRKAAFENLATQNAQSNINLEKLRPYLLPVPTKAEQEAISEALSDADALIESLEQLIAKKRKIKQGAMQELLTGKRRLPVFEKKPAYKQTEAGVIPVDWAPTTIGEITTKVGSGITPRGGNSNYKQYGRPFVRSQNVGWGTLQLSDLVYIDNETHHSFSATELKKGDVLLNITGASIGRSAIADYRLAGGNVNQHVCIIRTEANKISSSFINYLLLSSLGQRQIDSFQAGGNREGLNFGQIRAIKLPLPPTKDEQEAIASILNDMDTEINVLETKIAKARQVKQGMMQELLTGRIRLI